MQLSIHKNHISTSFSFSSLIQSGNQANIFFKLANCIDQHHHIAYSKTTTYGYSDAISQNSTYNFISVTMFHIQQLGYETHTTYFQNSLWNQLTCTQWAALCVTSHFTWISLFAKNFQNYLLSYTFQQFFINLNHILLYKHYRQWES